MLRQVICGLSIFWIAPDLYRPLKVCIGVGAEVHLVHYVFPSGFSSSQPFMRTYKEVPGREGDATDHRPLNGSF